MRRVAELKNSSPMFAIVCKQRHVLMSSIGGALPKLRNIGDSLRPARFTCGEGAFARVLDVRALTSRGTVFLVRY